MEKSPPKWHRLPTDSHLLLYRFDWEPDHYTFYLTDLQNVYVELLSYKQIIKRAFHYDTVGSAGIEPQANLSEFYLLLGRLESGLTMADTTRVSSPRHGLQLDLQVKFPPSDQYASQSQSQRLFNPNPVLSWHFAARPLPSTDPLHAMAFQTLLAGLLGVIDAQHNQIGDLCTLLKKKDFHLRHLKDETGGTSEPAIHKDAYGPFERGPWISQWLVDRAQEGEDDIVNIVRRSFAPAADMLWGYHARGRAWTDKQARLIKLDNAALLESSNAEEENDDDEITESEGESESIPKLIRRNSVLSSPLQSPRKPRLMPAAESALKRELESDQPPPLTFKKPCLEAGSRMETPVSFEPAAITNSVGDNESNGNSNNRPIDDGSDSRKDGDSASSTASVVSSPTPLVSAAKRRPKRRF